MLLLLSVNINNIVFKKKLLLFYNLELVDWKKIVKKDESKREAAKKKNFAYKIGEKKN